MEKLEKEANGPQFAKSLRTTYAKHLTKANELLETSQKIKLPSGLLDHEPQPKQDPVD